MAAAIASAIGSAVGAGLSIAGTSRQIEEAQKQTDALLKSMDADVASLTASMSPQLHSPELTTPERGVFLPQASEISRQPTGPSYGWIAPVLLGVAGLGILAWILTKKR